MSIRTVRNGRLSLFQSLVAGLVSRPRPSDQPAGAARQPTLDDPTVRAATVFAERVHAGKEAPEEAPEEVQAAAGGHIAWKCVRLAGELFLAHLEGREKRAAVLTDELKDSTCDPEWVESVATYLKYFGPRGKRREIPYVTYQSLDDFVLETLPAKARVALVGDWGTGTEDARRTLELIAAQKPDCLVHLGDIYYSGTRSEAEKNFLELMDEVFGRPDNPLPVYTMTGNHDMYSGGEGYYSLLPKLNPSPPFAPGEAQPASFLSLRTRGGGWQLLLMDTGLHDHDPFTVSTVTTYLEPREARWHLDKIERFHAAGGKTVLLSHHQLFSAFEMIGEAGEKKAGEEAFNPKLLATFREVLADGKVAAWFWGHEHNLAVYRPYPPLAKGRCIGHGAIPVLTSQGPYRPADGIPRPPELVADPETGEPLQLPTDPYGVYRHGWVLLELDDEARTAEALYYLETDGEAPFYRETLE